MRLLKLTVEVTVELPDDVDTNIVYLKLPPQVRLDSLGFHKSMDVKVKKVETVNWSVPDESYRPYPHYY